MHKIKTSAAISAAAVAIAVATACSFYKDRPRSRKISLADYIYAVEKPGLNKAPTFDLALSVQPVKVACYHWGTLWPNRVFRGKFARELRDGAVAYFKRRGRFANVSTGSGDVALVMKWTGYEGGGGRAHSLAVKVEIKLYHVPSGVELLVGKAESSVHVARKTLKKPVKATVGGKELVLREGTFAMAQICHSLYKLIDKQLVANKKRILKRIPK